MTGSELGRLVVDLARAFTEAERLRHELEARLIHERLAVDGVPRKAHALLERCARQMLNHDVGMMGGARVRAGTRRARLAGR